jgi:hypothetical protein
VIEARGEPRLVQEHARQLFAVHELVQPQCLDDEQLVEGPRTRDHGEIDLAHSAASKRRDELVLTDAAHLQLER